MPKIDLLPCPFCGGDRIRITKPTMWQAWCMDCKAIGTATLTEREAIEAWNTRTPDWIPCSERMPEDYRKVLIYGAKIGTLTAFYTSYKELYIADHGNTAVRKPAVIQWMPLPQPQKGDTE